MPEEKQTSFSSLIIDDVKYKTLLTKKFRNRKKYAPLDPGLVSAFIPGTIIKVYKRKGRKVEIGDRLCILEAMKMQNIIMSPIAGRVKATHVRKGQMVHKGHVMFEIE